MSLQLERWVLFIFSDKAGNGMFDSNVESSYLHLYLGLVANNQWHRLLKFNSTSRKKWQQCQDLVNTQQSSSCRTSSGILYNLFLCWHKMISAQASSHRSLFKCVLVMDGNDPRGGWDLEFVSSSLDPDWIRAPARAVMLHTNRSGYYQTNTCFVHNTSYNYCLHSLHLVFIEFAYDFHRVYTEFTYSLHRVII